MVTAATAGLLPFTHTWVVSTHSCLLMVLLVDPLLLYVREEGLYRLVAVLPMRPSLSWWEEVVLQCNMQVGVGHTGVPA